MRHMGEVGRRYFFPEIFEKVQQYQALQYQARNRSDDRRGPLGDAGDIRGPDRSWATCVGLDVLMIGKYARQLEEHGRHEQ